MRFDKGVVGENEWVGRVWNQVCGFQSGVWSSVWIWCATKEIQKFQEIGFDIYPQGVYSNFHNMVTKTMYNNYYIWNFDKLQLIKAQKQRMALLYAENGVLGYDYYYSIYTRVDRKIPNPLSYPPPFSLPSLSPLLAISAFPPFPRPILFHFTSLPSKCPDTLSFFNHFLVILLIS